MARVFVDANTLVSGIVFSGPEHELLKKGASGRFEFVTSEDVVSEVLQVIGRKFPSKAGLAQEFLSLCGIRVIRRSDYAGIIGRQSVRDRNDRHVLAAAIASRCQIIVSGDKDLLSLGKCRNIRIEPTSKLLRPGT